MAWESILVLFSFNCLTFYFLNMGPLLTKHVFQLYILFYMKHVIRKTFLLKPQDLSEEKFFVIQVVHEFLNIFLCFSF